MAATGTASSPSAKSIRTNTATPAAAGRVATAKRQNRPAPARREAGRRRAGARRGAGPGHGGGTETLRGAGPDGRAGAGGRAAAPHRASPARTRLSRQQPSHGFVG